MIRLGWVLLCLGCNFDFSEIFLKLPFKLISFFLFLFVIEDSPKFNPLYCSSAWSSSLSIDWPYYNWSGLIWLRPNKNRPWRPVLVEGISYLISSCEHYSSLWPSKCLFLIMFSLMGIHHSVWGKKNRLIKTRSSSFFTRSTDIDSPPNSLVFS